MAGALWDSPDSTLNTRDEVVVRIGDPQLCGAAGFSCGSGHETRSEQNCECNPSGKFHKAGEREEGVILLSNAPKIKIWAKLSFGDNSTPDGIEE